MKDRNKAIPAAYVFLKEEGEILLARRCNTGYQDGMYQVPAGHVEEGELPVEAIIREAKEEIGINLSPKDLKLVHVSYRPKHDETGDRVDFFFEANKWKGKIINTEPNKCDSLKWVSPKNLPPNTTFHVRKAIQNAEHGVFFDEIKIEDLKAQGLYSLK